jgi:glycosyltransferase involved in cell wall biosynthesis
VAQAVLRLLDDPEAARRMAAHAHAACTEYTWDATRSKWLECYRAAVLRAEASVAPVHA